MQNNLKESHTRSIIKSFSWRITGTIDTILISRFIIGAGGGAQAFAIGFSELFTKVILYYLHERFWVWLLVRKQWTQTALISFVKALSWRILGTLDTIVLASLITTNSITGLKIGALEVITKLLLYYLHERAWTRLPLGTVRKWFGFK